MNCIILFRLHGSGKLGVVEKINMEKPEWAICEFPHMDAAVTYIENNPLFRDGEADYQIVEIDQL